MNGLLSRQFQIYIQFWEYILLSLFFSVPGYKKLDSGLAWLGLGGKAFLINQCNLCNRALLY